MVTIRQEVLVEGKSSFPIEEWKSGIKNRHIVKVALDKKQTISKNITDIGYIKLILLDQLKKYCWKCKYDIDDKYPVYFEEDEKEYRVTAIAKQKGVLPSHLKGIILPFPFTNNNGTRNNQEN